MSVNLAKLMKNIGEEFLPIMKVVCAPYSIPLGLINQSGIYNFDICYSTDKSGLYSEPKSYDEETTGNTVFNQPINITTPDIKSASRTSVITESVLNILRKNVQVSTVTVRAQNTANIISNFSSNNFVTSDGETYTGVENAYDLARLKTQKGNRQYAVFHCPPRVQQVTNIEVFDFTSTIENDIESMVNDIESHVTNEMKQNGVSDGGINALVSNNIKIKASLKENMKRVMIQSNQQNIDIAQGLTYIDRYGYCDNTGESSQGRLLKQTIDLRAIAVNIINTTTQQMMNNTVNVSSKSTVVVDRVQNYRVIFFSLVWNIVCLYLSFKLIKSRFTESQY
tara:strand:- start:593 stop:1606 length:1014 start_codon:yes stop_codon:yes gene_type:complete